MKSIFAFILGLMFIAPLYAQDENEDKPVRSTFETTLLIENQTVESPYQGGLQFQIQHRFGTVKNGITDIFGIYAPSNIRLALDYGITDRLMLGVGSTANYKLQDLQWKYSILHQTRAGKVPVSLSYYGNVVLDARSEDNFGPEENFKSIHRFSYFTQLILARKFSEMFSFQVAPGFIYYNSVEEGLKNANVTIHAGGRAKLTGSLSILAEYDQNLTSQETFEPKPNLAAGVEIGTATHAFQIFLTNYSSIINQRNLLYNANDFTEGDYRVGFNITVRF